MANLPQFPQVQDKGPPFLQSGKSKVEFVDGQVKDGPPQDPTPRFVLNVKVLDSSNPMNAVNQTHTILIKARGFSWGRQLQELLSAFGTLPKMSIDSKVAEALVASGKLKGRKAMVEQVEKSNDKGAVWREYLAAALEPNPVV